MLNDMLHSRNWAVWPVVWIVRKNCSELHFSGKMSYRPSVVWLCLSALISPYLTERKSAQSKSPMGQEVKVPRPEHQLLHFYHSTDESSLPTVEDNCFRKGLCLFRNQYNVGVGAICNKYVVSEKIQVSGFVSIWFIGTRVKVRGQWSLSCFLVWFLNFLDWILVLGRGTEAGCDRPERRPVGVTDGRHVKR